MTDTKDTTKPTSAPAEETKTTPPAETKEAPNPETTATEAEKPTPVSEDKKPDEPKESEAGSEAKVNQEDQASTENSPGEATTADAASVESKTATKPFSTVEINKLAKQLDQQFSHNDLDATIDVKVPKTAVFMLLLGLVLIIGLGVIYAVL